MDKKLIINASDLVNMHNRLFETHPMGDDIIATAEVLVNLRRLIDHAEVYVEPEEEGEGND